MKKNLLFLFSDIANKLLKNYPIGIYLFFLIFLSVFFFSCENEPLGASDPTNEIKADLPYTTKSMSLKDVPIVESYVRSILSIKTNKSAISKSMNDLEHGASFDIEKIVETTDSINNKNYSIRFVFEDTPENVFYNLVINLLPNGQKHAFVQKQTCNSENYIAFRNSKYNMKYFKGKIDLYYYTAFFGKKATAVLAKTTTSATPCQQSYYPNGDPIPTLSAFIGSGGNDTGSGGSADTSNPNSNDSNTSWPTTGGYGLSVFSTGNTSSSSNSGSTNTSNYGGSGFNWTIYFYNVGQKISNVINTVVGWFVKECNCATNKTASDPCPTIVPIGFTTFISEPENLAILRSQIPLTLEQWQWLHGKDALMNPLLNYININPSIDKVGNVVNIIGFFAQQNNFRASDQEFVNQFITQRTANPSLNLDFTASYLSPMNVDVSSIDPNTTEGAKFIKIYDELIKSPEFKKLFESIFKDSKRDNVKFEIVDRVFEDNNPRKKEVHATTSQDPTTNIITIKISKQILTAGTTMSQTKIENAKTILHECIHAYLFVKAGNPATGVDFVKLLNSMYPTANEQHDFMYNNMVPTMQKVLGEIRDFVTTDSKRAVLETYTMHPTINPLTSTPFNWQEFYKYLSYSGLDETFGFKRDFPLNSDLLRLNRNYIDAGKNELDR
jgi:hypothetical protein